MLRGWFFAPFQKKRNQGNKIIELWDKKCINQMTTIIQKERNKSKRNKQK